MVSAIFKYKTIKGPLHKAPALLKLILLLPLSVLCAALPSLWLIAGIFTAIITAFLSGITMREQLTDMKPVVFYALLMYSLSVFSGLFTFFTDRNLFLNSSNSIFAVFIPHPDFLQLALRLTLIVQFSALFFRTTSSLEIREAVRLDIITLFLCFIPEIFETWTRINLTWKARGGKNGFNKIKTLSFLLISISFQKAFLKSKALEARKNTFYTGKSYENKR